MSNPRTNKANSREELGPGSLEDLGSSEWLRIFTDPSKKPPRYYLCSNKGPFIAGLCFMLKRSRQGLNAQEIMMALKDKNRDYSLAFIEKIIGVNIQKTATGFLTPADVKVITGDIAAFALVLEFNRMGKSIAFIQERLNLHGRSFAHDFIQDLIRNEKQWELETLVDIHRQESVQSMSFDYPLI